MPMSVVNTALQLGLIVLLMLLARRGLRLILRQVHARLEETIPDPERLDRMKTLAGLGHSVANVAVFLLTGLILLGMFGIDITPMLAGLGVVGLGFSLAAQTLITDFIGGILILAENQYTVGDVIQTGEASGTVERITMRATYLRDIEGALHIVPNGAIRLVTNRTAEWARAVVDLNLAYHADIAKALQVLEGAAAKAKADDTAGDLLDPPEAAVWTGLTDWSVRVRLSAKTKPGKQWSVMSSLRRHAVDGLREAGIQIALPGQDVYHPDRD
jgi:small-conductance mechanosensitive channel